MSDKIPISLHNSDLFLNAEFTNTDRKEINTDTTNNFIFKKGASLGENNHLVSLHNSYLLPPLHSSPYLSKAVTSYLSTKPKFVYRDKSVEGEQSQEYNQDTQKDKPSSFLLSTAGTSFGKGLFPLRYELGSGLTPYNKAQAEFEKPDGVRSESDFVQKTEHPTSNQIQSKHGFLKSDSSINNSTTKSFSDLSFKLFDKVNQAISSSISREFLLVTTNCLVFTVLAIVQRGHYGKTSSLASSINPHNVLCASQVSNTTPSYLSAAGVRQYLHSIQAGYLHPVRHHIVGIFLGKAGSSTLKTGSTNRNTKTERFQEKRFSFLFCTTGKNTRNFDLKVFRTNRLQNPTYLTEHLIQPWYRLKACNTLNNKVVATRSLWQVDKNVAVYNDSQIRGFQYYLPFYKSQERLFTETDTIPSKRDTIDSHKTTHLNTFRKLSPSSCTAVSESVLKRCFYKYGFLLVEPEKRDIEFQVLKETDKGALGYVNQRKQGSGREASGDNAADDRSSNKPFYAPATLINKSELDDDATVHQGVIKVKNGSVLLAKRYLTWLDRNKVWPLHAYKSSAFVAQRSCACNASTRTRISFNTITFVNRPGHINPAMQEKRQSPRVGPHLAKSTPVKRRSHISFQTLKTIEPNNPFLTFSQRSNEQSGYQFQFVSSIAKALLPLVREPEFSRYGSAFNKIEDFIQSTNKRDREKSKAFFPFEFAWSKYNLSKLKFAAFVPVQNHVPIFSFMPDPFVRNTRVSGYQFPELQEKEISYLFRKRVIFHFYFNVDTSYDNTFVEKLFTQVTTPFRTLKSCDLITQVISTPFLINDNGVMVCQVRTKRIPEREKYLSYFKSKALLVDKEREVKNRSSYPVSFDKKTFVSALNLSTKQSVSPKTYTLEPHSVELYQGARSGALEANTLLKRKSEVAVNPDPIVNLQLDMSVQGLQPSRLLPHRQPANDKRIFENKFRSLQGSSLKDVKNPVPSFEMDRIEMQYTQIDLDERKNLFDIFQKLGREYSDYYSQPKDSLPALVISPSLEDDREIEEEGIRIFRKRDFVKNKQTNPQDQNGDMDSAFSFFQAASEMPEKKSISGKAPSKNEMQNHQFLVKNALRQAQEEIDNIAKKEEKGTEKDKQVIPPLTRLEALYTIRNRERKREQAKDLMLEKGIISPLRFNKTKLGSRGGTKLGSAVSETKPTAKHTPLPIFDKLFLYSDKPTGYNSKEHVSTKHSFVSTQSHRSLTPWLLSKFGDKNVCTDRKHSFFGEMSLPSKKVTAQEQKQIFQQKANPLLKAQTKHTELNAQEGLSVSKVAKVEDHNVNFHSVSGTIPLSLLSQFSVLNKPNYNTNQVLRFQVGAVKADRIPESTWVEQAIKRQNSAPVTTSAPSFKRIDTGYVSCEPDLFIPKNRIYFYNTLSQNKPCQGSTPKIKGTPLQSPVAHRVWQPKRMEPSTFRVSQRIQEVPVLPRITQKDWKSIMEWQLQKYFVEEEKRLWPLSLKKNTKLKIKKINLYLPWISIKKATNSLNASARFTPFQPFSGWPLTRLDLAKRPIQSLSFQGLSLEPSNPQDRTHSAPLFTRAEQCSETSYKTTNYWQLPTQQNLYTATLPLQKQTHRSLICTEPGVKQSSSLRTINTSGPVTSFDNRVLLPTKTQGICKKVFNESILFESVTKYSWLFVYTLVFVLMFKQLFTFVYKVGLKDFFINFVNSDFGRTITSEELRYSLQNSPLTELYRPTKRLEELFGLSRNKVQLLEIVWFLRNNCQGRNGIRGILLVGPPGVENVSVVQAIAGEANLPIIVQSLEKIAQDNEPQRKLEQLYTRAHKQAPCVLFLDQLDTIGARRDQLFTDSTRAHNGNPLSSSAFHQDKQVMSSLCSATSLNSHISASVLNVSPETDLFSSHGEKNNTMSSNPFQKNQGTLGVEGPNVTLNQDVANTEVLQTKQSFVSPGKKLNVVLRLLTLLDGITQSSGVVTVATARDLTKLDPALLRPKRFDRRIYLSLPNQQDRVQLFKIQTQKVGHIKEMPWNYLSLQTESMSAADIRSAINYSLFRAVLKNSVHTLETLEYGISCVKTLTDKRVEKK